MEKQEVFKKLKGVFEHNHIADFYGLDVTNLEEYLHSINIEKNKDNEYDENEILNLRLYLKFIQYLKKNSIGDIDSIIDIFECDNYKEFKGYTKGTKIISDGVGFVLFNVDYNSRLFAIWYDDKNFGVWENCGFKSIEYDGYLLFPTKKQGMYFCLAYKSK